ncbi:hypothetical protein AXF42_Ash018187 [Apostasia shenzhenica]|uniref:Uncharacterized protein n=1 Tax=Apostasia shenzhenica TaxID=1088818 RepID=A0A2I0B1C6_9ASPA|nr:hypothetical protein AXF42_Ash018187 [Apostasia shenzhenica]
MGWILVDRGSKATLPLTMPCRKFKSSAKDSARRPFETSLQRVCRGLYVPRKEATSVSRPWGSKSPTLGRRADDEHCAAFSAWILT